MDKANDKSEFGVILRQLREKKDLTQQQFADEIHVSRHTISKYETGEREPDVDTIKKIANFFEVSWEYLFTGIDDKKDECLIDVRHLPPKEADDVRDYACFKDIKHILGGIERIKSIAEKLKSK